MSQGIGGCKLQVRELSIIVQLLLYILYVVQSHVLHSVFDNFVTRPLYPIDFYDGLVHLVMHHNLVVRLLIYRNIYILCNTDFKVI